MRPNTLIGLLSKQPQTSASLIFKTEIKSSKHYRHLTIGKFAYANVTLFGEVDESIQPMYDTTVFEQQSHLSHTKNRISGKDYIYAHINDIRYEYTINGYPVNQSDVELYIPIPSIPKLYLEKDGILHTRVILLDNVLSIKVDDTVLV